MVLRAVVYSTDIIININISLMINNQFVNFYQEFTDDGNTRCGR